MKENKTDNKPRTIDMEDIDEEKLLYLKEHLLYYGNTILNDNPEKYLPVLEQMGLKCRYRMVTDDDESKYWSIYKKPKKVDPFYIIDLEYDENTYYRKDKTNEK